MSDWQATIQIDTASTVGVLAAQSGTIFIANAADIEYGLPATQKGLTFTFIAQVVETGTVGLSVSPVPLDNINGGTDDKDLINSFGGDVAGDSITVVGDGVNGWYTTSKIGTWAAEA